MTLEKNIHSKFMFRILMKIFESEFGKNLAFKGGTLCYFVYNLPRFSVDLDFDIIDSNFDEEKFINLINSILTGMGRIKEFYKKRWTYFWLFDYGSGFDNLKLEFNTRIWENNKYKLINFYGLDIFAQSKSTIFANKLVALLERKKIANRDIFDIWYFFSQNWPINEKLIYERTGENLKSFLKKIYDFVSNLPENYKFLDGLGFLVDEKLKSFVKLKMKKELLSYLEFEIRGR